MSALKKAISKIKSICEKSKDGSIAYEDGEQGYKDSLRHFLDSSSESSALAVQPGSEKDLSAMMKVISKYKVPFAIKSGGHSMVPNFSSTKGIHIYMSRFSKVKYNKSDKTLTVGAGCLWDRVYKKVAEYKRNVIGGASSQGVGVAGWMLGGGYSLKSNKYGLGIDNVTEFRIVLPSGKIMSATGKKNRDLYQALRGGGNNFGVVTQFTIKTHPQGPTYGASLTIDGKKASKVKDAILDYVKNETRKEAAIVAAFRHVLMPGQRAPTFNISVLCIFDAKKPSRSRDVPFKKFSEIVKRNWNGNAAGWGTKMRTARAVTSNNVAYDALGEDVAFDSIDTQEDGFREMSYDSVQEMNPYDVTPYSQSTQQDSVVSITTPGTNYMSRAVPAGVAMDMANLGELNVRGRFGCIMVSKYTKRLIDAVEKESAKAAKSLSKRNGESVIIDVWPFQPTVFENSPPGAAWPHNKKEPLGPLLAYFRWKDAKDDKFWVAEMKRALKKIREVALAEGCTTRNAPYYSNTSLEDITPRQVYRGNLKRLGKVRAKYDPGDVMRRAGGYRIPLVK